MGDERLRRLLLRVPKRRQVFEKVVATPGIHARGLSRALGIALGVVEHHIRVLEKHGVIFAHEAGRRRTLYAVGDIAPADAAILHTLRKPACRHIARLLLDEERSVSGLARELGEPATTVSYRLRSMKDAGLLDNVRVGRESLYMLRCPQEVHAVLDQHFPLHGRVGFVALVERARDAEPAPGLLAPLP